MVNRKYQREKSHITYTELCNNKKLVNIPKPMLIE